MRWCSARRCRAPDPCLWLRSLDHVDARQLAGTEDAQDPFWSPDSRWIGFFADGKLKKIPPPAERSKSSPDLQPTSAVPRGAH